MPGSEIAPLHPWLQGWYAAIGEQFTRFGTLQLDGHEVADPTGQYLDSSITQLVAGYGVNRWLALQINLPIIYREFRRPEVFAIDHNTVSGVGDFSVLAKVVLWHYASPTRRSFDVDRKAPVAIEHEPDFTISVMSLIGIKFPTGNTDRISEEFNEMEIPGAPESGIHGHDLTLGTGSYDGIFGGQFSLRYTNIFFEANLQFALRGEGDHHYDFANDLIWNAGPGYYFVRNAENVVGLQFNISGEHKDVDRFQGAPAEDTGMTSIFLGPRVLASHGRWSAEFSVEIPISIDNTALQVVPDYRLRAAISMQF